MKQEFLDEAIQLSKYAMESKGGGPFGCVIVKDGIVIGRGWNQVTSSCDPTAHAEVVAIREACRNTGHFHLDGVELYTSCEPCPMCLSAIYWAGIKTVFYANTRFDAAYIGFSDEMIYNEFSTEEKQVALTHVPSIAALEVFEDWKNNPDFVRY